MDIKKLKIDKYSHIQVINFPEKYKPDIVSTDTGQIEVILYYIDKIEDVPTFIEYVKSADIAKDNRTIFVYEKGRKDGVNRDTIYAYFTALPKGIFKMRAPMMCSLSNELSAFVQSYENL